MKKFIGILILLSMLSMGATGCSSRFWGGAAVGAAGAGAAYEIQNKRQMDRLESDLRDGRISQQEYNSRKEQIKKGSIIY